MEDRVRQSMIKCFEKLKSKGLFVGVNSYDEWEKKHGGRKKFLSITEKNSPTPSGESANKVLL